MLDGPCQQEMARHQQSYPVLVKEDKKEIRGHVELPVKMPTSAWMPFPMLFSVIGKHLSKSSIDSLEHHYSDFKVISTSAVRASYVSKFHPLVFE